MDLLKYSSNDDSDLNNARRKLWSDKYMLGHANAEPHLYDKALWMGQINRSRAELRKIAKELRANLPTKKVYRITMEGEAIQFGYWERAHSSRQAMRQATQRYKGFKLAQVEELRA